MVRGDPRSSAMSPFDTAHMISYSFLIEAMHLSCTVFEIGRGQNGERRNAEWGVRNAERRNAEYGDRNAECKRDNPECQTPEYRIDVFIVVLRSV